MKVLRNTELSGLQILKLICQVDRLMVVAPFTLHALAGYFKMINLGECLICKNIALDF